MTDTTIDARIKFAEEHLSAPDGEPFSLEGREWVRDEYWRPFDGFKLWPVEQGKLCTACSRKAGTIADSYTSGDKTRLKSHEKKAAGCKGLSAEPILMTILCLPRQSGKTFSTAALALSIVFREPNEAIKFVASAEDQSTRLFDENYRKPVEASKKLTKASRIRGGRIDVPHTKSYFELASTSHGSITGGTNTKVIIDEARDVPARVGIALMPSVFARGGWECPAGHIKTQSGVNDPNRPKKCNVCGSKVRPWFGRILIMSSAGLVSGGEDDWFAELVEQLVDKPDPNVHLYVATDKINPKIADQQVGMMSRVFGSLESTRAYADIETSNEFRRKGEDFLTKAQIDRVIDNTLPNTMATDRACVAFLDTSKTGDLTSLVICADDSDQESEEPWARLAVVRIDVWDPKKLPGHIIDPQQVQDHLDEYLPGFPLVALRVDDRAMPWAVQLIRHCKKHTPYRAVIDGVTKWREVEREISWQALEQRVLARTIRMPPNDILRAELRTARKHHKSDGRMDVREASRRIRHLDLAEGVAACCYLAHQQTIKVAAGPGQAEIRRLAIKDALTKARRGRPIMAGMNRNSFT